jgi:hypothetical protein
MNQNGTASSESEITMGFVFRRLAVAGGLAAGLCGLTATSAAAPITALAYAAPADHSAVALGAAPLRPPPGYHYLRTYYSGARGAATDQCALAGDEGKANHLWRYWYCWNTATIISELWVRA